jgi:hypothetical protein
MDYLSDATIDRDLQRDLVMTKYCLYEIYKILMPTSKYIYILIEIQPNEGSIRYRNSF